MRFVYIAPRYHTNQHFPVKALIQAGHEVSFLALTQGQSEEYSALHPTILGYSSVYGIFSIPLILKLWRAIKRQRPSAVIVRNPYSAYALLTILISKVIGTKVIFYCQTPKYRPIKPWARWKHRGMLRVTNAAWITPLLGRPDRYKPAFIGLHYIPFVIEPQTCPQEKRWFAGGVVNILSVGKFYRRKNHHLFLDAVGRLATRYPIRATIIGESKSTPELQQEFKLVKQYSKRIGLDHCVNFKTSLSFSDMQKEYACHDLFVLASHSEPAAVSLLEAMSHSLPVICSDSNGTQCYVHPGKNGFVFRSNDLNDMESCMHRILRCRESLMEMGQHSYELVISEHAPGRYVDALIAITSGEK